MAVLKTITLVTALLTLTACSPQIDEATPVPDLSTAIPTQADIPASPTSVESTATQPQPTAVATPTEIPFLLSSEASPVEYTLPLVVQHVTETSATLFFEVTQPGPAMLFYWSVETPHDVHTVMLSESNYQQVTLDNLLPGTQYRVELGTQSQDPFTYNTVFLPDGSWGTTSFNTRHEGQPLRVGVIGDSGFGDRLTYELAGVMAEQDLDFVIQTGDAVYKIYDNANPYEAFLEKWFYPFAPLLQEMPFYPVVGNHDVEQAAIWEGRPFYYHAFPPFSDDLIPGTSFEGERSWYAFGYGDIQFIMLNSQTFHNEPGGQEQYDWLVDRLGDTRFRHSIVVFHIAPYTSGRHVNGGIPIRSEWLPLFEASNVRLVLSGHDHNYERLQLNGITYIVSGGGSASLYQKTTELDFSEVFARRTHFTLLEISDNQIAVQAIAHDGDLLDSTVIPLPAP